MRTYTLAHLRDEVLLRDLAALVAQDRLTTAALLAHMAEVDARRLYAPAGYPSMHAYCVEELHLSEDAAFKRIRAARAARQFPILFEALAEGRLHLTAVCLLAPYLTPENVGELMEAGTRRRKSEIEQMLARRFSLSGMPGIVRVVPSAQPELEQESLEGGSGDGVCQPVSTCGNECDSQLVPERVVKGITNGAEMAPAPAERYILQLTFARSTHEKLRYAQALLSHAVPNGDVAQVLDRALDALITQLEKRKFGAGAERRLRRRSVGVSRRRAAARYIPAHVRGAVWERDQGQCTFVSASGHRCGAHRFLEFDHIDPVARGGAATVERIRLRCRAHNQYEAERAFGEEFMSRKRREARLEAAEARARTAAEERATIEARARAAAAEVAAAAKAANKEAARDVLAGLRELGCRAEEARRAAEFSETIHGATLEERMRAALTFLGRKSIQGQATTEVFHGRS